MTRPTDRETALVMFRSTLALHGTPSPEAARIAIMFAARMAAEAGMTADEHATLAADEYALANSDLATTEQVIRALRTENERLRTEVAALREERDEALRLLATRVEAKRLDAAQEEIERLRAAGTLAVCADLVEMNDAGVPCPPRLVVLARMAVAKARGE